MHFVDEYDRAPAGVSRALGRGHHVLDFLDAGEDGAERDEFRAREARDEPRERRLAAAGRAPENHRAEFIALDLRAQRFARAEQRFLADEFLERARAHAVGKRTRGPAFVLRFEFDEEAHARLLLWRAASYSRIEVAAAAFSDSSAPGRAAACGIVTRISAERTMSCGNPAPSLPIHNADGPRQSNFPGAAQRGESVLGTGTGRLRAWIRFSGAGCVDPDACHAKLKEQRRALHAAQKGETQRRARRRAKRLRREWIRRANALGCASGNAGRPKSFRRAEDCAHVAWVLQAGENHDQGRSACEIFKGPRAGINQRGDALRRLRRGDAREQTVARPQQARALGEERSPESIEPPLAGRRNKR